MKKIWSYLAVGFFFMSVGIVIGAKYITGQNITIEVKKIKNKRVSGGVDITTPIVIEKLEKKRRGRKKDGKG
jgi:hypothetical protein